MERRGLKRTTYNALDGWSISLNALQNSSCARDGRFEELGFDVPDVESIRRCGVDYDIERGIRNDSLIVRIRLRYILDDNDAKL